jgi:protein-S-isoprenylcysteine O-methyltransferase Ste14
VFQDRPVYKAASVVGPSLPYVYAALDAANARGGRVEKLNAGTDSLLFWLGFQWLNKKYNQFLKNMYEKHPDWADKMNRHPILMGGLVGLPGMFLALGGSNLGVSTFRAVRQRFLQKPLTALMHSRGGDVLAKAASPIGKVLSSSWFQLGFLGASLAFVAVLAVSALRDATSFGRAYGKERKVLKKTGEDYNPYQLKQQVLAQRYQPPGSALRPAADWALPKEAETRSRAMAG